MITAIVQFKLPKGISRAEAAGLFQGSAPKYRGVDGLVRKYYLFAADDTGGGVTGGGAYLWESRAAAEKVYDAAWRKMIADRYGSPPDIRFFETPVIVDNLTNQVTVDDAA
jgi:hypothetical protein